MGSGSRAVHPPAGASDYSRMHKHRHGLDVHAALSLTGHACKGWLSLGPDNHWDLTVLTGALCLQGWGRFAKLAYAAGLMDCTESLTWGGTAILAGLLPNGPASTAAYSITIQSYR